MTGEMLLDILNGNCNRNKLIVKSKNNKYYAYFKRSKDRIGIGSSELEALENLRTLIKWAF